IPVPVFDEAARLALTTSQVQPGDVAIQASPAGTWMLKDPDPSDPDSWVAFVTPESPVQSVNGQTGTVVLGKGDVGLGSVDNTPDAAKPVSSAQQTALDGKVPTTRTIASGTGLSGGGDLTVNRTLAVQYGVTSGTACQGNDSRLSDARTPTAHTHAATDITSGTLDTARIPNLAASKITSGTLDSARLPAITSAMITDGTIVDADINASAAIAKSKLASDVQTSLGKADTASQLVVTKVANEAAWSSGPKTSGVLYYWTA
uniref:hypothetical protein n=1 Tax=Gordonia sp. (in: high G+C Gram-positive bacteria) TaxID=84139 RepID=UPI0026389A7C